MAQKSDAELTTQAQVIRDETQELANTKTRVYNNLKDIIDSKVNNDSAVEVGDLIASNITSTATGGIAATNVQAAIAELDSEIDSRILDALAGLKWKEPVRVATTVAGTLATSFENGDTVDGVVLATGDRILLKNQADQTANGIYTVNASGAPTRATDANTGTELESAAVTVEEGTSNANTTWLQTTDGLTLGSSNIVFTQYGSSVPDADASTKGIAKLYTAPGSNTDGALTQDAASHPAINNQTADYLLLNSDDGKLIEMDVNIANDITIQPEATVPYNNRFQATIVQMDELTSIIAGAGVNIRSSAGHLNSPGVNTPMQLFRRAADDWYLWNGLPSSVAAVQDFSSSLTPVGFSSVSVQRGYYSDDGQIVHMTVEISGTSNNTAFQFSVPIALDGTVYSANGFMEVLFIQNVGAGAAGRYFASGSGTLVSINATVAGGTFTNSGTKACKLSFFWFK